MKYAVNIKRIGQNTIIITNEFLLSDFSSPKDINLEELYKYYENREMEIKLNIW